MKDKLLLFYFIGCTGIIPAVMIGSLSATFDLYIGFMTFNLILLVWYSLVSLVCWWFIRKEMKKEDE